MIFNDPVRLRKIRPSVTSRPSTAGPIKIPKSSSPSFLSFLLTVVVAFVMVNIFLSGFLFSPAGLLLLSLGGIALISYVNKLSFKFPHPRFFPSQPLQPFPVAPMPAVPVPVPVTVTVDSDELQEPEERDGRQLSGNLKPISRYSIGCLGEMKTADERKSLSSRPLSAAYPRVHEWARELGRFVVERVLSEIVGETRAIDQLLHSTAAMNGVVYVSPEELSRKNPVADYPANLRMFSVSDLQVPRELNRLNEKIYKRKSLETYFQVSGVPRPLVASIFDRWIAEGRVDPDYMEEARAADDERRRDERVLFHVLLTFIGSASGDGLGIFRTSEAGGGYVYEAMTGSVLEVFAAAISRIPVASLELRRLVQRWNAAQTSALPALKQ